MAASPAYPSTLWLPPNSDMVLEETYQTPVGFRDFPFTYVYDASSLTNGLNYMNQRVLMDGTCDFILRYIWGFREVLNAVGLGGGFGRFQYRTSWGSYTSSAPMIFAAGASAVVPITSLRNPDTWQVLPEKRYPLDAQISFDLYNVNVNNLQGPAMLGFTGVKRRRQNFCYYDTPYKYKELPYSYNADFVLNTAALSTAVPAGPITLQINIADYDFELQRILVLTEYTGTNLNPFAMTIYDNGGDPTSSRPVPYGYLIDNGLSEGGSGFSATNATGMVFPSPPLVYQNQGRLRYDIWSYAQQAALPVTVHLVFQGVQRLPCN